MRPPDAGRTSADAPRSGTRVRPRRAAAIRTALRGEPRCRRRPHASSPTPVPPRPPRPPAPADGRRATRCRSAPGSASSRSLGSSAKAASASSTWRSTTRSTARSRSRNTCRRRSPRAARRSQVAVRSERHARDLRGRPAQLRQRGPAAGAVRPPVAGQGLPLLGSERHGLHGDAVLRGPHAASSALRELGRAARRGLAERLLAPLLDALECMHARAVLPPRHRARQHPDPARRRPAAAARLRRRAARDRRHDAGADGDPQARLRADRAVRRSRRA